MNTEFMARCTSACADSFTEVWTNELNVVVGFGGFPLEMVNGVDEDCSGEGTANSEYFLVEVYWG